mgnify:FL=1
MCGARAGEMRIEHFMATTKTKITRDWESASVQIREVIGREGIVSKDKPIGCRVVRGGVGGAVAHIRRLPQIQMYRVYRQRRA